VDTIPTTAVYSSQVRLKLSCRGVRLLGGGIGLLDELMQKVVAHFVLAVVDQVGAMLRRSCERNVSAALITLPRCWCSAALPRATSDALCHFRPSSSEGLLLTRQWGGPMKAFRAVVPGVVGVLLSMSAAAQGPIASDQSASVTGPSIEATMMRIVPYPDEMYTLPGVAPAVPYASCYRVGRCSAYDLYRFRDRPNRLTRLAPEAPPESVVRLPAIRYLWFLVPVTPEEDILPKYRTTGQVRDEYRAVGRPIDGPN